MPQRYVTPGGLRLGFWQSAQRQAYKKRTLSKKRVARLEKESRNDMLYAHFAANEEKEGGKEFLSIDCIPIFL